MDLQNLRNKIQQYVPVFNGVVQLCKAGLIEHKKMYSFGAKRNTGASHCISTALSRNRETTPLLLMADETYIEE